MSVGGGAAAITKATPPGVGGRESPAGRNKKEHTLDARGGEDRRILETSDTELEQEGAATKKSLAHPGPKP